MSDFIVLFNSKACSGKGKENAEALKNVWPKKKLEFKDVLEIKDYKKFFAEQEEKQKYVLVGGDGTINHFVNDVDEKDLPSQVWYYPAGTGNDFWSDLGAKKEDGPVNITKLLKGLPVSNINGKKQKFINGVGYGIDSYCCEVGDKLRETSTKPVNYAGIAVKGLLFHYKPTNAKVTVDGVEHTYKKVWLAPVMKGRYYGGGMIPTPAQDRASKELSVLVWHGSGKLKTLINFPGIFKGEHIKKPKMCEVLTGKNITVEFNRGVAAQVDGETLLNVTKVECSTK